MGRIIIVTCLAIVLAGAAGYWYYDYNIRTLRFSEITGKSGNGIVDLAIQTLDFETDLTKSDIAHLKKVAPEWRRRMDEIEHLTNIEQANHENLRLVNDISNDPAGAKIIRKLSSLGFGMVKYFLGAL